MFTYKKHNPYQMHFHYEPDDCILKIEQTIAQYSASQALIEQIKVNWDRFKAEEEPLEQKGWFKSLIDNIKNRVESVDETLEFFSLHAQKFYDKFDEIKEVQQVVMANIEHQKAIASGSRQPPCKPCDSDSEESGSEHSGELAQSDQDGKASLGKSMAV